MDTERSAGPPRAPDGGAAGAGLLAPSTLPATAVLELTYDCNHSCTFCSCPWMAPPSGPPFPRLPELEVPAWEAVISRLSALGVDTFAFTGGEPLLKAGATDLIRFAARQRCRRVRSGPQGLVVAEGPPQLFLLSNGRVLTEEHLQLCAELDVWLSLSLPGLRTFAEHTGGGDPDRVLRLLQRAHSLGVTTTVAVTVTRRNLPELYETAAAGLLAGADRLLLNRFLPGGRGLAHAATLALSVEQLQEALLVADEVLVAAGRPGDMGTELPRCVLPEQPLQALEVGTRCAAATEFFVVGPSGWARVCNHSPIRLAPHEDLDRLGEHPRWRAYVRRGFLPAGCRRCPLLGECDGGCREAGQVLYGCLDGADPLLPPLDSRAGAPGEGAGDCGGAVGRGGAVGCGGPSG